MAATPSRVNLSNGAIRCTVHTDHPLPPEAWHSIIAPLADAIQQAAQALTEMVALIEETA